MVLLWCCQHVVNTFSLATLAALLSLVSSCFGSLGSICLGSLGSSSSLNIFLANVVIGSIIAVIDPVVLVPNTLRTSLGSVLTIGVSRGVVLTTRSCCAGGGILVFCPVERIEKTATLAVSSEGTF